MNQAIISKIWWILGIIVVLGSLFLLANASNWTTGLVGATTKPNLQPLQIGFTGPLSGELSTWGDKERKGIDLAIEEWNARGGIDDQKVAVVYQDSQCQGKMAAQNLEFLVSQGIQAVIGDTCSSATLAAAPIAERNKIVLITPISGADSISQSGDYIFRNFIPNAYYGKVIAERITLSPTIQRIAVLYINNDTGVSWKNAFEHFFGKQISGAFAYNPDEKDFRVLLTRANEQKPDLIIIAGYYPDGALILKQVRELGIETPFWGGGDAFDDPVFVEASGTAAEGFVFPTVPEGTDPTFQQFEQRFEFKYGEKPSLFASYAYDTVQVVLLAMQNCGAKADQIKQCLYKTDYQGITNRIRFDDKGDLIQGSTIFKQIKNGKAVLAK